MEISVISMEICTNVIVVTSFTWKGQGQMQYTNQKGLHFFFFFNVKYLPTNIERGVSFCGLLNSGAP